MVTCVYKVEALRRCLMIHDMELAVARRETSERDLSPTIPS